MSSVSRIYVFDDFELDERAGVVRSKDELLQLTNAEYSLLRFLVKNPNKQHSYHDLYEEVFGLEGRSRSNTIPQHIWSLNKKLRHYSNNNLITNIQRVGYRFDAEVRVKLQSSEIPIISDENRLETEIEISNNNGDTSQKAEPVNFIAEKISSPEKLDRNGELIMISGIIISILFLAVGIFSGNYSNFLLSKLLFIGLTSVCYAGLNAVGLILECAYEFDKYREKVYRMLPATILINFGAVISGFAIADGFLQQGYLEAFWAGFLFLIAGAVSSCLCGYFVLPNKPIAKARVQTQPAFAAFCKNVILYFLPLYSTFGLLLYCLIYGRSSMTKNIIIPILFGILWLIIFAGSLYSTFYFTDTLLTEENGKKYKYYSLYFSLLMVRAALFFGPTVMAVIWYLFFILNYYDY